MLLRNASVAPGVVRDVEVAGSGDDVDVEGCVVVPGLRDDHIHLLALAAARRSVDAGDVRTAAELVALLRDARRVQPEGWLRAVGLDPDVAVSVDRSVLDDAGNEPVRVQDRSGSWWLLNSAALAAIAPDDHWPAGVVLDGAGVPTGRLVRVDEWLRARLPPPPDPAADLRDVGRALARRGVTALTDATATNGPTELAVLASAGLPQRVTVMTASPDVTAPEPLATGSVKILLDDSDLPSLPSLVARIGDAHRAGRAVAAHCVTAAQLALTLAALDEAGHRAGDRIEHASVVDAGVVTSLARSGVQVVTQPGLVWSRGDRYLEQVDEHERPGLYRVGSLLAAGVPVTGSSDAPYGPSDPWVGIRAAVDRRTRGGQVVGPDEGVEVRRALGLWSAASGDVCVVDGGWDDLHSGGGVEVLLTLIDGMIVP